MVDAALNVAAEQVIEYSAYGSAAATRREPRPDGGAAEPVPHQRDRRVRPAPTAGWRSRSPPTSSGRACAPRSGRPDWATDPELATADGRRRHHDRIDEHLSRVVRGRARGDEIVETLWSAGVPVAKVMQPHRQSATCRNWRTAASSKHVDHPVNARPPGTARLPCTSRAGPQRFHRTPAPLLGQHNHELLSELGLSDDEIAELEDQGVIGTAPAMRGIRTTKTG